LSHRGLNFPWNVTGFAPQLPNWSIDRINKSKLSLSLKENKKKIQQIFSELRYCLELIRNHESVQKRTFRKQSKGIKTYQRPPYFCDRTRVPRLNIQPALQSKTDAAH